MILVIIILIYLSINYIIINNNKNLNRKFRKLTKIKGKNKFATFLENLICNKQFLVHISSKITTKNIWKCLQQFEPLEDKAKAINETKTKNDSLQFSRWYLTKIRTFLVMFYL